MTLDELDFDEIEVKGSSIVLPSTMAFNDAIDVAFILGDLDRIGSDIVHVYFKYKNGLVSGHYLEVNLNMSRLSQMTVIYKNHRSYDSI